MDRKLATIQKIKSLIPIENADKIVLAEFEDIAWRCIVNKDDFKVGDYAVYIEIDAVLPDESKYEFLRKRCWVDNGVWEEIAFKFDLMRKLSSLNRNIAIQGEIVGPGIQGNKYKFSELQFFCYGAYDIENQKYLNQRDWYALMLQLKIPMVPLIDTNFILNDQTVDNLLEYARGNSTKAPIPREGVVFRLLDDKGSKISFKVVNNDFLIEFGE